MSTAEYMRFGSGRHEVAPVIAPPQVIAALRSTSYAHWRNGEMFYSTSIVDGAIVTRLVAGSRMPAIGWLT